MKISYLFTLLLILSTPAGIAKQSFINKDQSITVNVVKMLEQLEKQLAIGQMDKLESSWATAESEWQKLFDVTSSAPLNKTYNHLQVSYLQFQNYQDVDAFRRDLRIAVNRLADKKIGVR